MNLFGGKVQIRPLLRTDQPAGRAEVQARLFSPAGEFTVLADGVTAIRHLCYVELREGKLRGNHYHKLRHENFYVIAGETELHLQHRTTGERTMALLRSGDLAQIGPDIIHAFFPRSSGHAVEFAPEPFDPGDVFREVLL